MELPVSTVATQGPLSWLVPCGAAAPSVHVSHTYFFSGLLSFLDKQERDGLPDLLENFVLFCVF